MSREAMEAVQDHSSISDPTGITVFMAIARFVGPDGSPGWASYRTLAQVAHCDKDTVSRWVGLLQESGELDVRREGAGRGTRTYYTINLPFNEPRHGGAGGDNNRQTSPSSGDNKHGDNIERLSQQVERLSQMVELLSQRIELMSPETSQNVPTREGQKPETNEKPKGNHGKPSGTRPLTPLSDSPADQRTEALAEVCGLDPEIETHRSQCENAAVKLGRYEADFILQRYLPPSEGGDAENWNWYVDDWRSPEQPKPMQVVETISKRRVNARASPNGSQQETHGYQGDDMEAIYGEELEASD